MTLGDRLVVMKDGAIRQAGPPMEIHDAPADAFVAGFIGTPAMNLVPGEVRCSGGAAAFVCPAFESPLSGRLAEAALRRASREGRAAAVLGVRPSAVSPARDGASLAFAAQLLAIERHGDRADLLVESQGIRLVGRVASAAGLDEGGPLRVGVDLAAAHLFSPGADGDRWT